MISGVGRASARKLLARFKTPEEIFDAHIDDLAQVDGVSIDKAKAIKAFDLSSVDNELKLIKKHNIRLITIFDEEYPEQLKTVDYSPLLLYIKGELVPDDKYAIAVVGSRDLSEYGRVTAFRFASELAKIGFSIVSGLARGIDTVAHKGAISVGARTIAVLGSGFARLYPRENSALANVIAQNGAVLSEFPMQMKPNQENFPQRNRTISGLSLGVLIVEAVKGSGSLITASFALSQGREVFAIPGNISSANSYGTNELIKKGEAKLVQSVQDIVDELSYKIKGMLRQQSTLRVEITAEEKALCQSLTHDPKHIDEISRQLQMPVSKVSALLASLEIKGLVGQLQGKKFYLM